MVAVAARTSASSKREPSATLSCASRSGHPATVKLTLHTHG